MPGKPTYGQATSAGGLVGVGSPAVVDTPTLAGSAPEPASETGGYAEEFYKLIKILGKRTIIYHKVNGAEKICNELIALVNAAIRNSTPVFCFIKPNAPYGEEQIEVYYMGYGVFIIIRVWNPYQPYCWEEKVVELINVYGEEK